MYSKLPNGQIIYEEDYSCVLDPKNGKGGIYIGNLEAAQNLTTLKKNNIKSVLTAAKSVTISHPKNDVPFYLHVPGEDRDGFDLTRFFSQAINFIRDSLESTNILVHCLAGVSRSVCLVLAYLMKCRQMTYSEAYSMVKARRKIIHPNDGFIKQLKNYESELQTNGAYNSKNLCQEKDYEPKRYSVSPTKRRYEYFNDVEGNYQKFTSNKIKERQASGNIYESPSKYNGNIYDSPSKYNGNIYESPPKYNKDKQIERLTSSYLPFKNYESPIKRPSSSINYNNYRNRSIVDFESSRALIQSPTKRYDYKYQGFSPSKLNLNKISSLNANSEGKNYSDYDYESSRLNSSNSYKNNSSHGSSNYRKNSASGVKMEAHKKLFGTNTTNIKYGQYNDFSATQLSEQLDRKIAKIREKYAQYTKNDLTVSRKTYGRESSRLLDENDAMGALSMKKITSDIERSSKFNPEIGLIRNNYGKSSGLEMRKLNSLTEGYY